MREIFLLVLTILVLKLFFPDIANVLEKTILTALQFVQQQLATQTGSLP